MNSFDPNSINISFVDNFRTSIKDWVPNTQILGLGLAGWTALKICFALPVSDPQAATFARVLKHAILKDPESIKNPQDRFCVELAHLLLRTTHSMSERTHKCLTQIRQVTQEIAPDEIKASSLLFKKFVMLRPDVMPTQKHFELLKKAESSIALLHNKIAQKILSPYANDLWEGVSFVDWGKRFTYFPLWPAINGHCHAERFKEEMLKQYQAGNIIFASLVENAEFDEFLESKQESLRDRDEQLEKILTISAFRNAPHHRSPWLSINQNADDFKERCIQKVAANLGNYLNLFLQPPPDDVFMGLLSFWEQQGAENSISQLMEIKKKAQMVQLPPQVQAFVDRQELESCSQPHRSGSVYRSKRL